jgi:hypothetical protein
VWALANAEKYALQCVGNYFDASTPELFEHVLKVVVTQALNTHHGPDQLDDR